ncbi:UNVERIFIED_CONTAM: hypothetical protein RMT77_019735 [Armadillidium vulgare]
MLSDASGHVKAERLSPDPPAATDSPNNNNNRTPPNPTFTPPTTTLHSPYDRFSPAALGAMGGLPGTHGPMKQMETIMTKNCSELMRSLAAKYNYRHPNE